MKLLLILRKFILNENCCISYYVFFSKPDRVNGHIHMELHGFGIYAVEKEGCPFS